MMLPEEEILVDEEKALQRTITAPPSSRSSDDGTGSKDDKKSADDGEVATVREVFSFGGENGRKTPCLIFGWFLACITGCIYPAMAFLWARIFEELGSDPTAPDFMDGVRTQSFLFLGLGGISFVTMTIQNTLLEIAAAEMTMSLKTRWFNALLRQDMAYFDIKDVAGTATLIAAQASKYNRGVGRKLGEGLQFTITLLGGFGYAFYASWKTTLITLTVLPFMAGSSWFMLKTTQTQTSRATKNYEEAGSIVYTTVSSIKTVLSLNACRTMLVKYKEATLKAFDAAAGFMPVVGLANGSIMASFILSYVLLTLFGTYLLYDAVLKTGCDPSGTIPDNETCPTSAMDVFGALMGVTMAAAGLPQISAAAEAFTVARGACYPAVVAIKRKVGQDGEQDDKVVHAVDRRKSATTNTKKAEQRKSIVLPKYVIDSSSPHGRKLKHVRGGIDFRNVTFSYPTRLESTIFNGFSLRVEPGTTVALVGPSGSGKSSAVALLERFYDCVSGSISLDGVDIRRLNVRWLRQQIGLVSQEPVLFAKSIGENIAYGCPGVTQHQIEDAARMANAHEFISSFPQGYDTLCGDKGAQLSGGQKQRIALARVLVMNPKILLLDEATSALDSESERVVQQALDSLLETKRRTTLVIAHRLSTIKNADKIAVVDGGRVVETGTHDELMADSNSHYRRLVEAQTNRRPSEAASEKKIVQKRNSSFIPVNGNNIEAPQLRFRNVHFAYPTRPDNPIFTGLNLSVRKGETLALVGESGGGKSTVIQLVERFYDADIGNVELEGIDMKELNVHWLRDQMGLVGQEPVLFNCSIGENIKYGMPTASQAEIEAAAKLANAHKFIMSFPEKYNTYVGERGTQMSGGQKQRLAIARAIIKRPKILLLDEATSALDSESEKVVQEALDNVMDARHQTTLVIAHRLSTVRHADRIAVIEAGKVREVGSHDELMEKPNGKYRRLIQLQNLDGSDDALLADVDEGGEKKSDRKKKSHAKSKTRDDGDESDGDGASTSSSDDRAKENAKRARLMAKADAPLFLLGSVGAVLAGVLFPAWGIIFAFMIEVLYYPIPQCPSSIPLPPSFLPAGFTSLICEDDSPPSPFDDCGAFCDAYYNAATDEMKQKSFKVTYGYLGLMLATMIGNLLLFYGFGTASERMNKRVRDAAFNALIRLEPAWFDKRTVGSITTQLQDDAAMIHSFSGEPIRTLVMNLSSVLVGVVISFVFMWPFALLTLFSLPAMSFGAMAEMRLYYGEDEVHDKEDENSPGGIVVETLLNMRTVASLTIEKQRSEEYKKALEQEHPDLVKSNIIRGATTGLGFATQMWCMALWFWWGGFLLWKYPGIWTYRDFLISIFSLMFSLSGMAAAAMGATNKEKAKEAAGRIFELIDQKSKIDPLSSSGKKGV